MRFDTRNTKRTEIEDSLLDGALANMSAAELIETAGSLEAAATQVAGYYAFIGDEVTDQDGDPLDVRRYALGALRRA